MATFFILLVMWGYNPHSFNGVFDSKEDCEKHGQAFMVAIARQSPGLNAHFACDQVMMEFESNSRDTEIIMLDYSTMRYWE